jgi:WD40 repeat protein
VGDIDGDGYPEVILQNAYARVLGLNHDGTSMAGWPQWVNGSKFFPGSCALADLTGNGKLEVIIPGMNGYCYIFRDNGSALPGWPKQYAESGGTESSPVVADISGDGSPDIILGGENGKIHAWDIDGNYLAGFPIQLKNFVRGTPSVIDIDLDGDLELIASCWDENVYIWDLDAKYTAGCIQWSGFHGNRFNSGWKELLISTDAAVTAWMYEISGSNLQLTWSLAGDARIWDLYRRVGDEEYVLAAEGLVDNGSGTIVWTDGSIEEGMVYEYRLESAGGADVVETGSIEIPVSSARLYQNHPNPFNPATTIVFTIPGDSARRQNAILNVYDVKGALVKTLVNGPVAGGRHEVTWDGTNSRGTGVSSGVYFARFATDGARAVKKLILVR